MPHRPGIRHSAGTTPTTRTKSTLHRRSPTTHGKAPPARTALPDGVPLPPTDAPAPLAIVAGVGRPHSVGHPRNVLPNALRRQGRAFRHPLPAGRDSPRRESVLATDAGRAKSRWVAQA